MVVKAGYKQTEIGTMPDDWQVSTIEEKAIIKTGGRNTQDRDDKGQYPFFVRSQTIEKIDSYSFDGEAVLTAGDGVGTGKIFHYINGRFDCHQRVYRISDFSNQLNGKFFYRVFSNAFYDRIMSMTAKSSVDSVRRDMIAEMRIPLPPLPEQKAIANALSDVDQLIASLDQLIAKKRDFKQAAMQQLLTGKTRLQGFSGEWETKRLGDVLQICHGKDQKLISEASGMYPILATGGEIGRTNSHLHDQPSVLIGRKGTIDKPQYMDTPFWTVDTLFYSIIHQPNVAKFLYYFFCTVNWRSFNEASGVPSLNARTIEKVAFMCPDPKEQLAITEILSDMDAELTEFEQRRDKTNALKQGMMQELLTGRTRLV